MTTDQSGLSPVSPSRRARLREAANLRDWMTLDERSPQRPLPVRRRPTQPRRPQWERFPEFWDYFEKVKTLGEGSFGLVYHMRHRQIPHTQQEGPPKEFAVKVLHAENNPNAPVTAEQLKIIDGELRVLERLSRGGKCQSVVCHLGHFQIPAWDPDRSLVNPPYRHVILTDVVPGVELFTWISDQHKHNNVPLPDVMRRLMCSALQGLAYLHGMGVVHRDIKPENMMIVLDENNVPQRLVFIDFGLSCSYESSSWSLPGGAAECVEQSWAGTPEYMAPEIYRLYHRPPDAPPVSPAVHERILKAGDVYSLGQVFWIILQGTAPPARVWVEDVDAETITQETFVQKMMTEERPFYPLNDYSDQGIVSVIQSMLKFDYTPGQSLEKAIRQRCTPEQALRALRCPLPERPSDVVARPPTSTGTNTHAATGHKRKTATTRAPVVSGSTNRTRF